MQPLHTRSLAPAGFIVKPFGFKGEIVLASEISDPEGFPATDFILVIMDGLPVPFKVLESRIHSGQLIMKLEDVDNEEQAKKLNGLHVSLFEEDAGEEADEIAYEDLSGFMVIDAKEGPIGAIESVEEYPMQLLAKCTYKGQEVLIPLNDSIVSGIDQENKTITTELPEGLLDIYKDEQ